MHCYLLLALSLRLLLGAYGSSAILVRPNSNRSPRAKQCDSAFLFPPGRWTSPNCGQIVGAHWPPLEAHGIPSAVSISAVSNAIGPFFAGSGADPTRFGAPCRSPSSPQHCTELQGPVNGRLWRPLDLMPPSKFPSISSNSNPLAFAVRGGGKGDGFSWDETAEQVRIRVLVEASITPSEVCFELKGRRLKVYIQGHEPLLQGTLRVSPFCCFYCWCWCYCTVCCCSCCLLPSCYSCAAAA